MTEELLTALAGLAPLPVRSDLIPDFKASSGSRCDGKTGPVVNCPCPFCSRPTR